MQQAIKQKRKISEQFQAADLLIIDGFLHQDVRLKPLSCLHTEALSGLIVWCVGSRAEFLGSQQSSFLC